MLGKVKSWFSDDDNKTTIKLLGNKQIDFEKVGEVGVKELYYWDNEYWIRFTEKEYYGDTVTLSRVFEDLADGVGDSILLNRVKFSSRHSSIVSTWGFRRLTTGELRELKQEAEETCSVATRLDNEL